MDARAGEMGADGFIIGDSLISVHSIKDNEWSSSSVWTDKAVYMQRRPGYESLFHGSRAEFSSSFSPCQYIQNVFTHFLPKKRLKRSDHHKKQHVAPWNCTNIQFTFIETEKKRKAAAPHIWDTGTSWCLAIRLDRYLSYQYIERYKMKLFQREGDREWSYLSFAQT